VYILTIEREIVNSNIDLKTTRSWVIEHYCSGQNVRNYVNNYVALQEHAEVGSAEMTVKCW
jgi:hypothetical protein